MTISAWNILNFTLKLKKKHDYFISFVLMFKWFNKAINTEKNLNQFYMLIESNAFNISYTDTHKKQRTQIFLNFV